MLIVVALVALVAISAAFTAKHGKSYSWQLTPTGVDAGHFRGLSVVSPKVVWASGYIPGTGPGVVVRTTNGGTTWQSVAPPGSTDLQFRDIQAFDANHAVLLSIGNNPDDFRVYVTSDGGAHWTQTFTNAQPTAFYDCMSFWDKKHGIAVSDPVNGKFQIISTTDGGNHWQLVSQAGMPAALPNEAGFAASGECLVTGHRQHAWFGSGQGAQARVFRTNDGGTTWQVSTTPITSSASSGVNGLAFRRDDKRGIAVGGDFTPGAVSPNPVAITSDGGKTWKPAKSAPSEYRSGVAWLHGHTAIDVGLAGSDVSTDGGNTWTTFDTGSFDTVDCAGGDHCWASGAGGRVGYLVTK
jgi:photosystem II stability/assembly factor-like uncharacterized protein